MKSAWRDLIIGVTVIIVGAAIIKGFDIPTRVAVLETGQTAILDQLKSMDSKIDILIGQK